MVVRGVTGQATNHSVRIVEFDSVEEAVATLGAPEVLRLVNYAHGLNLRQKARRRIVPEVPPCPKCGGQCGYWNRPLGCGK